jgi:hypothetical protein
MDGTRVKRLEGLEGLGMVWDAAAGGDRDQAGVQLLSCAAPASPRCHTASASCPCPREARRAFR